MIANHQVNILYGFDILPRFIARKIFILVVPGDDHSFVVLAAQELGADYEKSAGDVSETFQSFARSHPAQTIEVPGRAYTRSSSA